MKDFWKWLTENWGAIVTVFGGGAAGVGAKKITDRNQDNRIKSLIEKTKANESAIKSLKKTSMENSSKIGLLETEIEKNSLQDDNFRKQFFDFKDDMKKSVDRIHSGQEKMMDKLYELAKNK